MTGTLRHRTPLDVLRGLIAQRRAERAARECDREEVAHEAGSELGKLVLGLMAIGLVYALGSLAAWWSF